MSSLKVAELKTSENNFRFDDLPGDRQDPIRNELLKQPFQLSVQELSALKNARFSSFGCIDSLININLFLLTLTLFLFTSRSELSTLSSSISGVEKVPLNPLGTNSSSSLSDITNSTFSIACSPDEAVKSEDVSSVPIPNGIFWMELGN